MVVYSQPLARATSISSYKGLQWPARALYIVILKHLSVLYNYVLDYLERVGFHVSVVNFCWKSDVGFGMILLHRQTE